MTENETISLPITTVILAGGRSMRMGMDKTQIPLGGLPLVARAVANAGAFSNHVVVVTNRVEDLPTEYLPEDLTVLKDSVAYQGPLGGLATALAEVKDEWVLACAADMPWIMPQVVEELYRHTDGYDVVLASGPDGPEPLCALYRTATVAPVADKAIASGRRRLIALFDELRVCEIPIEHIQKIDPDLRSFFDINTQVELAEARELADKMGLSTPEQDEELLERLASLPYAEKPQPVRVMMSEETGRQMPSETPITIYLNDVEVATVQATVTHIDDMAIGFLITEGLLTDREKFKGVDVDKKRGFVYVTSDEDVPDGLVYKTRYVTSGCGKGTTFSSLGHARGLEPITQMIHVGPADLYRWMAEMSARSDEYREHGGSHSCGLVVNNELLAVREDVGRHNAADKLLGHAWRERVDMTHAILLSTGRISYEMIVKAAKCRIPFVASRSAATDLAAEIAETLGITLGGYVRGGKVVIYAHPERLIPPEEFENEEG
ncbi:MAG: formate dehydrogenase accessory sulfurtransferase FdhD [Coriobacteriia bacterium]|nr:formate dehydrogenase accessory sulfurtransferase FdhD [Coriobacteriia bacterium]